MSTGREELSTITDKEVFVRIFVAGSYEVITTGETFSGYRHIIGLTKKGECGIYRAMKKKLTALFVKQAVRSLTRLSLGSNTQALMRKQIADLTRFGNQLVSMRSA